MRAARYLGVPPWELAQRPTAWRDWALLSEAAEHEAERRATIEARRQQRIDEFAARGSKRGK